MSVAFRFLKIQYQLKNIDEGDLKAFVKSGKITQAEYNEIIGG